MRHRAILLASVVAMALLASPTALSAQRGPVVSLSTGAAFPGAPVRFAEAYRWAIGGGLGLGIVLGPRFTIQGSVDYSRFMVDRFGYLGEAGQVLRDLFLAGSLGVDGGAANVLTVLAGVRVSGPALGGIVSPYVTAGLGEFLLWTEAVTLTVRSDPPQPTRREGGREAAFGVAAGLGVEIAHGERVGWFLEGRWVVGFTHNGLVAGTRTTYVPIRMGLSLR